MTMSIGGLVSGLDTTTLITQLLQAEAAPQVALKKKLATAQVQASAYRTVNSTFAAVKTAAEALSLTNLTAARTATSTSDSVTANAASSAVDGSSLTFTVTALAAAHSTVSTTEWTSPTADVRTQEPAWPIEILNADGSSRGTVDVPAGATLADAAKAITDAALGVKASVVRIDGDSYRLALTSTTSGSAGTFVVKSATEDATTAGSKFLTTTAGSDATLDLGAGLVASSATNTFADLLPGVSVTVSKVDFVTPVTVSVGQDAQGVAGKVQALADAVNAALSAVKTYTSNAKGSTAALKGDSSLTSLAGQLLGAVSSAVGGDGSPAAVGFQLTKDGTVTFDKAKFTAVLEDDPTLAQRMVSGRTASLGADGVVGGGDDVTAVTGIAGRLLDVSKAASDSTTGSILALAKGKDSLAEDIKDRIEAFDLRLVRRREILTRQFTAMETALSSLQQQSSWLAGQINSLPSYS